MTDDDVKSTLELLRPTLAIALPVLVGTLIYLNLYLIAFPIIMVWEYYLCMIERDKPGDKR